MFDKDEIDSIKRDLKPLITIEKKKEADLDVLVIRQKTTKTTGFHTDKHDVKKIIDVSLKMMCMIISNQFSSVDLI